MLLISLLIIVPISLGIFSVRVETNLLKYFKPSEPLVQDALFIDGAYGGSSPLDIVVRTGAPDGARAPEVLQATAELQRRLEAHPGVERGLSLADLLSEMNGVLLDDPAEHRVPETSAAVAQFLMLVDPSIIDPMLDPDGQILRLAARFEGARMGGSQARVLLDEIRGLFQEGFPEGVDVTLAGSSVLFVNMDEYLVNGQIESFGSGFHPGIPMFHAYLGVNWVLARHWLSPARNRGLGLGLATFCLVVFPLSIMAGVPLTEPIITGLSPRLSPGWQIFADFFHFSTTFIPVGLVAAWLFRWMGRRLGPAEGIA